MSPRSSDFGPKGSRTGRRRRAASRNALRPPVCISAEQSALRWLYEACARAESGMFISIPAPEPHGEQAVAGHGLVEAHRGLRHAGDALGQRARLRHQLRLRHHLVDDARGAAPRRRRSDRRSARTGAPPSSRRRAAKRNVVLETWRTSGWANTLSSAAMVMSQASEYQNPPPITQPCTARDHRLATGARGAAAAASSRCRRSTSA